MGKTVVTLGIVAATALCGSFGTAYYRQSAENRRLREELAARERSANDARARRDADARRRAEELAAERAAADALRARLVDEEHRAAVAEDSLAKLRNGGPGGRDLDDLRQRLADRADSIRRIENELKAVRARKGEVNAQGKAWEDGAKSVAARDQAALAERVTALQLAIVELRARVDELKRAPKSPERAAALKAAQAELNQDAASLKDAQERKRLVAQAAAADRAAGKDNLRARRATYERSESDLRARLESEKADYARRKRDIEEISLSLKEDTSILKTHEAAAADARAKVTALRDELRRHETRARELREPTPAASAAP